MLKVNMKKKIKDLHVEFIQLQFVNILGEMHSVEIPASHIDDILDNKIMIDGSSIKGYTSIDNSDLFLCPDFNTFMVVNFLETPYKVARFICDVLNKDGSFFDGSSRGILKKLELKYSKKQLQLLAGLEAEFFFLKKDENNAIIPADNANYFDTAPADKTADLKREISVQLIKHGFDIEALHKEVSPGQHEINFKYDNVLKTADKILTFKWIVKIMAKRHGYIATFMPKPFAGVNGSGLHSNISIFKNDKNLFCTKENELSQDMMHFIAGIVKRSREIALITNPTVNSYKRLIPGFEAPNCIAWSDSNRSAMIRIPTSRGIGTRVEVRCVDATSNPYIMLAVLFEAGIQGIQNKEPILKPNYDNLFKLSLEELQKRGVKLLPMNLGESIQLFKKSDFAKKILTEKQFNKYILYKQQEWDEYRQVVHQWEIDKYLKY